MPERRGVRVDPVTRPVDGIKMHRRAYSRGVWPVFDMRGDGVIGQLLNEIALPVVAYSFRVKVVEGRVDCRIRDRANHLGLDLGNIMEGLELTLALFGIAGPAGYYHGEHVAVPVFGDEGQRRGDLEPWKRAHLLGCVFDVVPVEAQNVFGLFDLVEHRPPVHVLDGVELVLQRGAHAEVPAAASNGPEKVRVFVLAGDE